MNKKALIVIDMQNDFITGVLGNEECQAIVPNIVSRIKEVKGKGYDLFYTKDTHKDDYLETQEGLNLQVKHCIKYTKGWELIPEIKDLLSEGSTTSVLKYTFGSADLAKIVYQNEYDEIELIGVCTDICIISNALIIKAFSPETKIIVNSKCCAGVTPERHDTALKAMEACQVIIK